MSCAMSAYYLPFYVMAEFLRERCMRYTKALNNNKDFISLYNRGKNAVTPFLAMYCRKNGLRFNRLGITVSSKIGKAVVRNRVRRRIKEAYRLNEDKFKTPYDIVIVSRVRAANAVFSEIEESVLRLGRTLGIIGEV